MWMERYEDNGEDNRRFTFQLGTALFSFFKWLRQTVANNNALEQINEIVNSHLST